MSRTKVRCLILLAFVTPLAVLAADGQKVPKGTKFGDIIPCKTCDGLGGFKLTKCKMCDGMGTIQEFPITYDVGGAVPEFKDCPNCSGKGRVLVPCRYEQTKKGK